MDDPWSDLAFGVGAPESDEAQALFDLQEALRACLADLRRGVPEICTQLQGGAAELRSGAEARSLALAMENLQGFFAVLAQMNESFEGRPLPALDRLDAIVNRGVARIEAALESAALERLAESVETDLLAAFDAWPAASEELEVAIAALSPGFLEADA